MGRQQRAEEKFGLTQLGAVFALFFLVLHVILKREDLVFILIAMGFLAVALFARVLLKPLDRVWRGLGTLLGRVVSVILLSVFYFVMLVPLALLRRLFGKPGLALDSREKTQSFWIVRERSRAEAADLDHQF